MNRNTAKLFLPIIIFILSFLVYLPSLGNSFVWDDQTLIERSYRYLKDVNYGQLFFPAPDAEKTKKYYRPIVRSSIAADYAVWELNSFGYHLTNNLLFSFTSVAFFFFILIMLRQLRPRSDAVIPAIVGTLVFILHPMHVESVSWISARPDIICALFLLIALICHMKSANSVVFLLAPLFFVLSLMSKEVAVAFPFLVIFYDILSRRAGGRHIVLYIVYILILILYLYVRSRSHVNLEQLNVAATGAGTSAAGSASGGLEIYYGQLKTLLCAFAIYIEKLIAPLRFSAYIADVPVNSATLLSAAVLAAGVALVFLLTLFKRYFAASFSIFFIVITLGPSLIISIMQVAATPVAERYLFIPSIGYAALLGYIYLEVRERYGTKIPMTVSVIILAAFLYLNIDRQIVWKDSVSIWQSTSVDSPYAFPHTNYAIALEDRGDLAAAEREYLIALDERLIDNDPGRAITANNLALLYIKTGNYETAEKLINRAYDLHPGSSRTQYNLGLINYIKGEVTGSREAYVKSLKYLDRASIGLVKYPKLNLLRAKVLLKLGEVKRAMAEVERAVAYGLEGELLEEANSIKKMYEDPGNNDPGKDTHK